MKHATTLLAALAACAVPTLASAQSVSAKAPVYQVGHEVAVTGKVVTLKAMPDWMGKDGVNLSLQGESSSPPHVDVAPASFLAMLDFSIDVGDDLELTGCWSETAEGTPVFLVHQLKKKRVMISVRGPDGSPLW